MVERAEELRSQLDAQRADITRTVGQIEDRVSPGRILNRRTNRMRRSMVDLKDRVMGNDEPDYPTRWYDQEYGPLGAGYDDAIHDTRGGRLGDARGRAGDAASGMSDRAHDAAGGVSDRASGALHAMGDRTSDLSDRVSHSPQAMRRQTQGNPMAMGLIAFGAGLVAATVLPESRREQQLARKAEPQLQKAVEQGRSIAGDVAVDLRETAQEAAEEVKSTATAEAQSFKAEASDEAERTRSDVEAAAKDQPR